MRRNSRLCNLCDRIDFDKALRSRAFSLTIQKEISLGTWEGIQVSTSCPFCRLVVQCVKSVPSANLRSHSTIYLNSEKSWKLCVATSEYDGELRSSGYSNKYDLMLQGRKSTEHYDRRLTITWKGCQEEGQIQYLSKNRCLNTYGEGSYRFLSRKVRSDRVNFELLNSWLSRCEKYHSRSCDELGAATSKLPKHLRVVDIKQMSIVQAPENCHYVAMSYVWGMKEMEEMGKKMPRTLRAHVQFEGSEGIIPLPAKLPLTIKDSIEVARKIGFRYIWNDALCIVQDDEDERTTQMLRMDAIYSHADLTIVAGSGLHVDYGLPGVSVRRRHRQQSEVIENLRLAVVLPSYNRLNSDHDHNTTLPWNKRGWTFQEKIMSRRILQFTDHQVYFKCKNAVWSEDTIMETDWLSRSARRRSSPLAWVVDRKHTEKTARRRAYEFLDLLSAGSLNIRDKNPDLGYLPNYVTVVEAYTKRELTEPNDVLIAINGILGTLKSSLGPYHQGLPACYFHEALLWKPSLFSTATRMPSVVPSWSWASWKFSRGCDWADIDLTATKTYAAYSDPDDFPSLKSVGKSMGCGDRITVETEESCHYELGFMPRGKGDRGLPAKFVQEKLNRCDALLYFKTEILNFDIRADFLQRLPDQDWNEQQIYHEIVDRKGGCVGEVLAPFHMAFPGACRRRDFLPLSWGKGMEHVNIAQQYIPKEFRMVKYPGNEDLDGSTPSSQYEVAVPQMWDKWLVTNVMLVEWDEGIARRVGIGKIIATAWISHEAPREWVFVG